MMKQMWSVSQLVNYIKLGMDHDENLHQLLVQGEISNLVKHRSGHYYFTLKDEKSRMSCVMFANYARLVRFDLKDGSKVIANCRVSVYEASGSVQLYVNNLQPDGIGELYLQFEQLKKKLNHEGYFDISHKKKIPEYPFDIAVISGKETAACHDVMTTIERRWPLAKLTLYPTLVQGNEASQQLITTLQKVDANGHDVILLVRGGGSLEDLWAFNHEDLAKSIYHAVTPIISGVGHETDITLVDYVSDARAATPTAAAELATPNLIEVKKQLRQYENILKTRIREQVNTNRLHLDRIKQHAYIKNPFSLVENVMMSLDLKKTTLESYASASLDMKHDLKRSYDKLIYLGQKFEQNASHLQYDKKLHLKQAMKEVMAFSQNETAKRISLMDAYSPLKILYRGYSLTMKEGHCIRSVDEVKINEEIQSVHTDGVLRLRVVAKEKKNDK